jgi:hypothetical protein
MADIFQPPGRAIAYFPKLTHVTGSIKAAILCQQVTFLTPREELADTWIAKHQSLWLEETGLTAKEFRGAVNDLCALKLIEKHYDRANHILEIQLNIANYNAAIQDLAAGGPLEIAPAKKAHAKKAHAKKAHAKKAHAKKAGGIGQKGTWHVPKGQVDNNVVDTEVKTEVTTEEKDMPPYSPTPADADVVSSSRTTATKFVTWWTEAIVPLGGRPFAIDDADEKFVAKANKALKAKPSKSFWDRVTLAFQHSQFLRGLVRPPPGKRRFKASLPWLLSLHHQKGIANYVLVVSGEFSDDAEPTTRPYVEWGEG